MDTKDRQIETDSLELDAIDRADQPDGGAPQELDRDGIANDEGEGDDESEESPERTE